MPFLNQIIAFINEDLKKGSLNKEKLQPAKYYGLSSLVAKSTTGKGLNQIQLQPAITDANGKSTPIAPDSKMALQVYHKLNSKTYSRERKSYGDDYLINSVSDVSMIVITNAKITGKTKDVIEPVIIFGMPQRISDALTAELKIIKCLITPIGSNMNQVEVFRQEFPQAEYFLNEQVSMFLIRYKIELTFSQRCAEQCLCN